MARGAATSQWRFWIIAAFAFVLAAALFAIDLGFLAPLVASIGAFFGFAAWISGRDAREIALTHASLQALTRGRFDEVERIHAEVPARKRVGQVGRAIAIQRATMAFYRGDPERTVALLGDAVEPRGGVWEKSHVCLQRANALALRALAYASLGDDARAEADAAIAESIPEADAGAVGARRACSRSHPLEERGFGRARETPLHPCDVAPRDRPSARKDPRPCLAPHGALAIAQRLPRSGEAHRRRLDRRRRRLGRAHRAERGLACG